MTDLDPDGCLSLCCAFWELVRYDLATGNHDTRQWLRSDDFDGWAAVTLPISPDQARIALSEHWQSALRDPDVVRRYRRWERMGSMHRRMA